MDEKCSCLICESDDVEGFDACLNGFLKERIEASSDETKLVHCKKCGFAYFLYRLQENEARKLYAGYRSEEYQKQRQKHDVWYTKKINALLGKNLTEIKSRNNNLTKIIQDYVDVEKVKSVLDFGGDTGVFIPDILSGARRDVFDISGVPVLEGINLIKDKSELENKTYDFVMCAHVLEHVANPEEIVKTSYELVEQEGYFYVELPLDSPFYQEKINYWRFLFNKYFNLYALACQFVKTVFNKKKFMSEHINYFTEKSIQLLLEKSGFKILHCSVKTMDCEWCEAKVISVLAKK